MDTSSQRVAAALSRMREREIGSAGFDRAQAYACCSSPTGCLLTIRLTRLVFDSGNQARDRCGAAGERDWGEGRPRGVRERWAGDADAAGPGNPVVRVREPVIFREGGYPTELPFPAPTSPSGPRIVSVISMAFV